MLQPSDYRYAGVMVCTACELGASGNCILVNCRLIFPSKVGRRELMESAPARPGGSLAPCALPSAAGTRPAMGLGPQSLGVGGRAPLCGLELGILGFIDGTYLEYLVKHVF